MWLRAPDYREAMERAWRDGGDGGNSLTSTWSTLKSVASSLQTWSKRSFGVVHKNIQKLERRLRHLRQAPVSDIGVAEGR
jgi:hypothetical protein